MKLLKKRDYEAVYQKLVDIDFEYSFGNIIRLFPRCKPEEIYTFLMYSIAKEESAEKHIAVCEFLYFGPQYIYEATTMIRWHILRAIEIDKTNVKAMSWAMDVFGADPSSPFSEKEMTSFAKEVSRAEPDNEAAKRFLKGNVDEETV